MATRYSDISLINSLLEDISQNPPAIEARKLLIEQYVSFGWDDAASDQAAELLQLAPTDVDAQRLHTAHARKGVSLPKAVYKASAATRRHARRQTKPPVLPQDLTAAQLELAEGYRALLASASTLLHESETMRSLLEEQNLDATSLSYIPDLTLFSSGRISSAINVRPPPSAQSVARAMQAAQPRGSSASASALALDIACDDLADTLRWLRASTITASDDERASLLNRVRALEAALPSSLRHLAAAALMHAEHEVLQRRYVVSETMYGDAVSSIPRSNFWVSADGYPWDLAELATALKANAGVMRNPMTREMFTADDVKAIVAHPLGRGLAALRLEQAFLSKGVRGETITRLETLGKVLLGDQTEDSVPSRLAVEAFLAYLATLPAAEQDAVERLKVPAKDSHTGLPFDASIGEAVRDAQGNRICFHKAGDLIQQAGRWLRQQ